MNTWHRVLAVLLALSCLALPACSDEPDPSRPSATTLDITVRGDTVEPNGKEVRIQVGGKLTLRVHADRPGELHVHSSPEQAFAFETGTESFRVTLDKPGQVDVEEHESEVLVARLVVE